MIKEFLSESWLKIRAMDRLLRKLLILFQLIVSAGLFMGLVQARTFPVLESFLIAFVGLFMLLWTIVLAILWKKDLKS